ncbi:MAG: hypothetical protein CMM60_13615 [Rhodospirillaceae bacterium]|jgi:hypothetical protein|nr:hypothetical protein [Rhodospirillaceae bacterium]|tara:strand:+ start:3768 stop:4409 length:642 start_codon:yes stop_codon:yes gene_type:complete
MVANIRRIVTGFGAWALIAFLSAATAGAEPAKPLPPEDCKRVRLALESRLPFGPGFRRLEVEFPKNDNNIEGHVCRLLTMGTGAHMEGYGIGSLSDMRTKVMAALNAGGWTETAETGRFSEKSTPGREVFALSGNNAICVTTIVVGLVDGAEPGPEAKKDGKVRLSALKPYQREWWISIDCFGVPGPLKPPAPTAKAAPDSAGAPGAIGGPKN